MSILIFVYGFLKHTYVKVYSLANFFSKAKYRTVIAFLIDLFIYLQTHQRKYSGSSVTSFDYVSFSYWLVSILVPQGDKIQPEISIILKFYISWLYVKIFGKTKLKLFLFQNIASCSGIKQQWLEQAALFPTV